MDTSFWIQCNPDISVEHTNKKYFGKYLYKIAVYCPGGRLIEAKGSLDKELERRKNIIRTINYGGWWGGNRNRDLDHADLSFLSALRTIKLEKNPDIRMRVEEPMIQIYANDEEILKNLVLTRFESQHKGYIKNIARPENAEAEQQLNQGAIIRKLDNGYRYKIILKDGRYGAEIKQAILNYLSGLGSDMASLPKSCKDMLSRDSVFMWNVYFYSNDPSVNTFLELIAPGIVSNCHELVVRHN